nr:germin-like protein 9-3 [Tanacetum cinerariifolium]
MLKGKWTPMNREETKFNSIYDQTKALSDENEENLLTQLHILYKEQTGKKIYRKSARLFLKDKYKWKNPESTQARRTSGRVTGEDPEFFGDDVIPASIRGSTKVQSSTFYKLIRYFRQRLDVGGSLEVGFVDTTNKLFTQTLQEGDIFVFPKGLVHFQFNNDAMNPVVALSAFGSANAGTVSVPNSVFNSTIDSSILALSFKTDVATIQKIKAGLFG